MEHGSGSPLRKWTVAVWVAGDNNLDSYGATDLGEMKKVGSNDDVAVVAQFDRMGDEKTRRYYLRADTSLDDDVVEELGETNTGDPQVAIDFFKWAYDNWPSEKTVGIIWNHGSGIDETDVYARAVAAGARVERGVTPGKGVIPRARAREIAASGHSRAVFSTTIEEAVNDRAVAYDDTSRDFLDNAELQRVLAEVVQHKTGPIDIFGFDACLMNMVEVAYQLRGMVDYVVGSEEVEPGDGWPYDAVVRTLVDSPDIAPLDAAASFVASYVSSYRGDEEVTQSALDVSRVEDVASATKQLAATLAPLLDSRDDYGDISMAANNVQRFEMNDFADLGDLCSLLAEASPRDEVKQAAQALTDTLFGDAPLVIKSERKGTSVDRATGAAIYFPVGKKGDVQVAYDRLDFGRDAGWATLLSRFKEVRTLVPR
jgi:hypothetical protein